MNAIRIAAALTALLPTLVTAICLSGVTPAVAAPAQDHTDATSGSIAPDSIPGDLMRRSGPWVDSRSIRAISSDGAVDTPATRTTAPIPPAPFQFKTAEPSWLGALDTFSTFVSNAGVQTSNLGISGKNYGPTPRVNSPVPPSK